MGVYSFESETKSSVAPAKLFKAMVHDFDNLLSKAMPDAFKGCEIIEGNGGPGTIKLLAFSHAGVTAHVKHKIEAIDEEQLSFKFSNFEGDTDMFKEKLEKIEYAKKIEESGDGGSILKSKNTYHTKGDYKLKEEELKEGEQKDGTIFKTIEAYVLANPDY